MYQFRKAELSDIDAILVIVAEAQVLLASNGVDQWQDGYPNRDVMMTDIDNGNCYVMLDADRVIAFGVVVFDGEAAYDDLHGGKWLTNDPYITLHRFAITATQRGKGYAMHFIRFAEQLAAERGFKSFRLDTHADNNIMQGLAQKAGFTYCGVVYYDSGSRYAYEKLL